MFFGILYDKPQPQVLLSDVSEVSLVMVGVASYNRDGRQSSVASTTYHPPTSTPQPQQQPQQPEQYRLVRNKFTVNKPRETSLGCTFDSVSFRWRIHY